MTGAQIGQKMALRIAPIANHMELHGIRAIRISGKVTRKRLSPIASGASCARVAASIPFAEDLLAAYYCAFDRNTPLPVKTSLIGALAYFVLPIDAIPDVLPVLGFTDDAAMLATHHQTGDELTSGRNIAWRRRASWRNFRHDSACARLSLWPQNYLAHDLPGGDCLERGRRFRKRIDRVDV